MSFLFVSCLLAQAPAPVARDAGLPVGKGTTPATVTIRAPSGGWSVDRMILVKGTISDKSIDPVLVSINGDRYLLRTFSGEFARKFPAAAGKNTITVMATNQGGTGSAQVTTYAQAPAVPLKTVLTSDTNGVYTDLHIYEPTDEALAANKLDVRKMAHVYWANTRSPSGGTFFLNEQGGDFDQPGYGPYLYIHRAPPKGVYLIATNYWPSGDKAHTIATLNLSLFEGTPQEVRRKVQVPLATPGTTRVLAWVNIVDAGKAQIYVPGQDPSPTKEQWPDNLEEAGRSLNASGGESL